LCSALHVVQVIKSRIRWTRQVARTGDMKKAYKIESVYLTGRDHLGDEGKDGNII